MNNYKKYLEELTHRLSGERHDFLAKIAGSAKAGKIDIDQGIQDTINAYMAANGGYIDDAQKRDVVQTFEHFYSIESTGDYSYTATRREPQFDRSKVVEARTKWLDGRPSDPRIYHQMMADAADFGAKGRMDLIFRHARPESYYSFGVTENDVNMFRVGSPMHASAKYVTMQTYKESTSRLKENIDQILAVLMEIDDPLDGTDKASLAKEALREKNLKGTAIVIDALGVTPTAVTFSGNKSYHAVYRLSKPITREEFEAAAPALKSAYMRIGLDPAVLTANRLTRAPKIVPLPECAEYQHTVFASPDAEIDFQCFCDRINNLADEIIVEKDAVCDEFVCPVERIEKGDKVRYVAHPELLPAFIESCGFFTRRDNDNLLAPRMLCAKGEKYWREVTTQDAVKHMANKIAKAKGDETASMFVHFFEQRLQSEKLGPYLASKIKLHEPHDDRTTCRIPYANGVLEITREGSMLVQNHYYDISFSAPSARRDYKDIDGTGEFEVFVDRICGKEEKSEIWGERKKAIMTLLGYLVCRDHEAVNYMCILTEETETENDGGTGKSIVMKSIKYIRKRFLKNCKGEKDTDSKRFYMAGITPDVDYVQFDDIQKTFSFEDLFTMATDDWVIELKGRNDPRVIPAEKAPKMVFGTNYYPRGVGESFKRRMRIYELSNHYHGKITPETEFGHRLFSGWTKEEWQRFDKFICSCVMAYKKYGLVECPGVNTEAKAIKVNMGEELAEFFDDYVPTIQDNWTKRNRVADEYVKWYRRQRESDYVNPPTSYTQAGIMKKLCEYCKIKGLKMTPNVVRKIDGQTHRCFLIEDPKGPF